MADNLPKIENPRAFVDLKYPLMRLKQAFDGKGVVRIVAMGSSSTAGRGDVVPYPYRLEMYLRQYFKDVLQRTDIRIDVLNRGIGGQEANEELGRFQTDIFPDDPALVIWQVGTNAVFHNLQYDVDVVADNIRKGLAQLRARGFEVLVIDPQYTTKMLWDDRADLSEKMVRLIRAATDEAEVSLFQRWALMRHWHVQDKVSLEQLVDPTDDDLLHQSDWSTMQVSLALKESILRATGVAV